MQAGRRSLWMEVLGERHERYGQHTEAGSNLKNCDRLQHTQMLPLTATISGENERQLTVVEKCKRYAIHAATCKQSTSAELQLFCMMFSRTPVPARSSGLHGLPRLT